VEKKLATIEGEPKIFERKKNKVKERISMLRKKEREKEKPFIFFLSST